MKTIKEQAELALAKALESGANPCDLVPLDECELIIKCSALGTAIKAVSKKVNDAYAEKDYAEADKLVGVKFALMGIQQEIENKMAKPECAPLSDTIEC